MSFFKKISEGLKKTRDALVGTVGAVFQPGRALQESDFEALEGALLRADVGPVAADRLLESVRGRLRDASFQGTPAEALRAAVESLLADAEAAGAAAHPSAAAAAAPPKPFVTLVVGVNGTGKTTTIAKLAHHYKERGESVLVVACDTFRAAAADQLEIWAKRAGAMIHRQQEGADPAAVAFDGVALAKSRGVDRVIVDTAGRLHVKSNLMAELEKIRRVIAKVMPDAPHETLLVLDAGTGQNGLAQAREFDKALKLSGLALTKLDGTAKGGVVLAIAETMKLPIRWVGVGEGMEDLIPFDPAEYARGLVGS
ncbi:MAG TPA: signal recognition particle-docking protein FtsY [Candidatus Eisenbacteria bacterium]|nr:signal recognition particle-docking protein FtsY [Candidatus Eisenbacteria bacterium]